ncbi:MAG: ferritin-like domain-containing protein [Pseudonocardiales bacterium]
MTRVETAALQGVLAAEHAAVWGYGVVGGHLPATAQDPARQADQAHRRRRDTLSALLAARFATPVAAAPDYDLPFPVADALSARRLAAHLEQGTAAAWHAALAVLPVAELRHLAVTALTDAAIRALQWRLTVPGEVSTVPFPGT